MRHLRPSFSRSAFGRLGAASASTPSLTLRSRRDAAASFGAGLPRMAAMVAVGNEGGLMTVDEISLFLVACGELLDAIAQLIVALRRSP